MTPLRLALVCCSLRRDKPVLSGVDGLDLAEPSNRRLSLTAGTST